MRKPKATQKQKPKAKKKGPRRYLSVEILTEMIPKYRGNFADIARSFGITREAVAMYVTAHPELQPMVRSARETRLDFAENALDKQIKKGNVRAIEALLFTLGRKRGYVRTVELGADPTSGLLPIQITIPQNGRELVNPVTTTSHDANTTNEPQESESESGGPTQTTDDSE